MAWQPFGAGPRNCIGLRLAFMKLKFAMIHLLLNFRIVTGPETQVHILILLWLCLFDSHEIQNISYIRSKFSFWSFLLISFFQIPPKLKTFMTEAEGGLNIKFEKR